MSEVSSEVKLLQRALVAMEQWQQHQGYTEFLKAEASLMDLHKALKDYFGERAAKNKSTVNEWGF